MRFVNALIALLIASVTISCMQANGAIVSNDASLISMAIVVAGALAGGD